MSLNNFHTNNYGVVRPIYPSMQDRMNEHGYAYHQPRDWDVPNRVPVARVRPADNTSKLMTWLKDVRNTELRSQGLTQYYLPLQTQANRTLLGDDVDSILLYQQKWPIFGLRGVRRYTPY